MKFIPLLLFCASLVFSPTHAAPPTDLGEVPTTWPGIDYQIFLIQRIPPDRLLIGVRILATAKAPAQGTLIGFPIAIPANANKYAVEEGAYHPAPLTLASSVMTDDATGQTYPALPAVAPPGKSYLPGQVLATLTPGKNEIMTVQFALPPPPVLPPGSSAPLKQMVSFLFTHASVPIRHVPIPPLAATNSPTP